MNTTKLKLIVATVALTVSGAVFAGAPWTYVDLGYITADSFEDSTDGVGLRGSFGFADVWHVGATASSVEVQGGKDKPFGFDETGYSLFVGLHPEITDYADLVLDLGYSDAEDDFGSGFEDDVTGVFLRAGPRAMIGEKFELSAYVVSTWGELKERGGTTTVTTDFNDVGLQVGGAYYFTPAWSVGMDLDTSSVFDIVDIYVRWSFQ